MVGTSDNSEEKGGHISEFRKVKECQDQKGTELQALTGSYVARPDAEKSQLKKDPVRLACE